MENGNSTCASNKLPIRVGTNYNGVRNTLEIISISSSVTFLKNFLISL